jgi:FtsP/CotA-like multicopper oxidase with cupredoxin domain
MRRLLALGVVAIAVIAGITAFVWFRAPVDTVGRVAFLHPLAIPPLAESELDDDGRRVFDLIPQAGTSELLPGLESGTWGFNGAFLGPTLRAETGELVQINVHNELGEATTVHWHGMHLPASMDGGPHQLIAPGEDWAPTWTIEQPAATLWYHPHPHGRTRDHVNRGLAGMFIIDDPEDPIAQALPHEYGVDDIPVIVQDHSFEDSGQMGGGNFGDTLIVNGTYGPFLNVTTQAVRMRLMNASAARVYNFGFSDDRPFAVIASDGGLLSAPVDRRRLELSPAERAEIVVRMRPGEHVVLRSYEPDLGLGWFTDPFEGGRDRFDVLELRAADDLAPSPPLPDALAPAPNLVDALDELQVDRTFELRGTTINGQEMDMARIDEVVEVDTTEVWDVENTDGTYHNFHVHGVQFQVVEMDGEPPPAEISGWKDTVFLLPGSRARLAVRFSYADPSHPYMAHCHRLRHEDRGMMFQFVVVEPGQSAGLNPQDHLSTDHG